MCQMPVARTPTHEPTSIRHVHFDGGWNTNSSHGKKGLGKGTKPKDGDTKKKDAITIAMRSVIWRVNVRGRKRQTMRVPMVEAMCIA